MSELLSPERMDALLQMAGLNTNEVIVALKINNIAKIRQAEAALLKKANELAQAKQELRQDGTDVGFLSKRELMTDIKELSLLASILLSDEGLAIASLYVFPHLDDDDTTQRKTA
jgi:hypothetical protein